MVKFKVRGIIFDVFETLLHNETHLWLHTIGEICRTQRLDIDTGPLWEKWRSFDLRFRRLRVNLADPTLSLPFRRYWDVWRDCFRLAFLDLNLDGNPEEAASLAVRDLGHRQAYPDALELIDRLRTGPWTLAVLSNADDAFLIPALERNGLINFGCVLSSEGLQVYKPHPRAYEAALEGLGLVAADVLMIGDSRLEDIHGASQAGIHTVLLNRKGSPPSNELTAPNMEIASLMELVSVLSYPDPEKDPNR